jgi:hypothetical protein
MSLWNQSNCDLTNNVALVCIGYMIQLTKDYACAVMICDRGKIWILVIWCRFWKTENFLTKFRLIYKYKFAKYRKVKYCLCWP